MSCSVDTVVMYVVTANSLPAELFILLEFFCTVSMIPDHLLQSNFVFKSNRVGVISLSGTVDTIHYNTVHQTVSVMGGTRRLNRVGHNESPPVCLL